MSIALVILVLAAILVLRDLAEVLDEPYSFAELPIPPPALEYADFVSTLLVS